MRKYMALQTELGWFVARIGFAGPRVISDRLESELAAGVCNILNDVFTDDWTLEHVRVAYQLVPDLVFPVWIPDWARSRFDPVRLARRRCATPLDLKADAKRAQTMAVKMGARP